MPSPIIVFNKNWADYERDVVTVTASEDNDNARNLLDRSNNTGWATSASTDASNTELIVDLGDVRRVTDILLLKHNLQGYTISYYDDGTFTWVPAFVVSNNSDESTHHYNEDGFHTSQIKIVIAGTIVTDAQKYLFQLIITERLGQFEYWPVIKSPVHSREKKRTKMISGKSNIIPAIGAFTCKLQVKSTSNENDTALIERLYDMNEGFLVWLCGGDESQFKVRRKGYRMEDLPLMRCLDDYSPELVEGYYGGGMKQDIELVEVIT